MVGDDACSVCASLIQKLLEFIANMEHNKQYRKGMKPPIELTDFISTGDADEANMVEVRCVFSDEEPTITEEEIMADVPYEIRKKFKGCTELFTAA